MAQQSDSRLPPLQLPPACSIRRSYVKVSSQEFSSASNTPLSEQPPLQSPLQSPLQQQSPPTVIIRQNDSSRPFIRLRFCDNSSGYNSSPSATSLSSLPGYFTTAQNILPQTIHITHRNALAERSMREKLVKESLTNMLDQIDKRVAFLRETARELEQEKCKLLNVLSTIQASEELNVIADVEREEIKVTTDCLLYRLNSVDVNITTPRSVEQERALDVINGFIDKLSTIVKTNTEQAKQICLTYLNTCSSEPFKEPIDERFQKAIIQCAVDDQKKIRRRLESLIRSIGNPDVKFVDT